MLAPISELASGSGFALPAIAVGLGCLAGAANVFGGLVVTFRAWERRYLGYFVALGAGFMLAVALLDVVPESLRLNPHRGAWLLLAGVLLVQLVEHSFVAHFHYGEETHTRAAEHQHPHRTEPPDSLQRSELHAMAGTVQRRGAAIQPYSVLAGLAIHTFFDGLAIGSGFLVSSWLGWVLFVAIFLHKVPEGFTVASVMMAAGKDQHTARLSAGLIGGCSVLGVVVMGLVPLGLPYTFPLSGGVTLYVAATDLLPEVNREPGIRMALWVFVGAGVVLLLSWVFRSTLL